jgi:transcriptional regulator with GAF, ATPase, and Fis domain
VTSAPVELELVVRQARNTVPVRVVLRKLLTTLGSSPDADVPLPLMPAQWVVVQRRGDGVRVRVVASGAERVLDPGQHLDLGDASLALADRGATAGPLGAAEIATALTRADTPDAALRGIVEGVLRSLGADSGAAVIAEGGGYRVAVAVDAEGKPLGHAAELLSDTLVRDVLGSGTPLCVGDIAGDRRYATVPSVVSLSLQSVVCVPMRFGDRVLGALFFGRRNLARPFSEAQTRELMVLGSMALPVLAALRRAPTASAADGLLVGEHPAVIELRRLIDRVAPSTLSVLVTGETGTGKEVTARAIHASSRRADRRMVAINCSAVAPSLLEAELFGYAKGAFTGAVADRAGRIEEASGSTLLLDEVGDMPLAMQAALLRVVAEREVVRVGESRPRPVDLRIIAATNRDLDAEVAAGRFREDLLFRLREITIELPPLRQRGEDVGLLARLFLHQAERELSLPVHALSTSAEAALAAHDWPGNVRELRAVMRRAAVLCDGLEITAADLQLGPRAARATEPAPAHAGDVAAAALGDLGRPLTDARDEFVRRYAQAVLDAHGGDRAAAADSLEISVRSLYRYLA